MSYIVSANYRDRESAYPWLVRLESEQPDQAKAYGRVTAKNVTFGDSNKIESGFGCRIVAKADSVETFDPEPEKEEDTELKFNYDGFDSEDGRRVVACETLELEDDGSMLAVGPVYREPAPRPVEPTVEERQSYSSKY